MSAVAKAADALSQLKAAVSRGDVAKAAALLGSLKASVRIHFGRRSAEGPPARRTSGALARGRSAIER